MMQYAATVATLAFLAFIAIIIYSMCVISHRSDDFLESYDHEELSQVASSELEKVIKYYEGDMRTKMQRVAQFEKISFEQFNSDYFETFEGSDKIENVEEVYNRIQLPVRLTEHSAGHDISIPYDMILEPGKTFKFPTGIRCKIADDYVMLVYVRSSVGIKKRCVLLNGTGVIDSDYYNAQNEGHIFIVLKNDGDETVNFKAGDRICQAVFVPFGITIDDNADGVRTGGIGSTN